MKVKGEFVVIHGSHEEVAKAARIPAAYWREPTTLDNYLTSILKDIGRMPYFHFEGRGQETLTKIVNLVPHINKFKENIKHKLIGEGLSENNKKIEIQQNLQKIKKRYAKQLGIIDNYLGCNYSESLYKTLEDIPYEEFLKPSEELSYAQGDLTAKNLVVGMHNAMGLEHSGERLEWQSAADSSGTANTFSWEIPISYLDDSDPPIPCGFSIMATRNDSDLKIPVSERDYQISFALIRKTLDESAKVTIITTEGALKRPKDFPASKTRLSPTKIPVNNVQKMLKSLLNSEKLSNLLATIFDNSGNIAELALLQSRFKQFQLDSRDNRKNHLDTLLKQAQPVISNLLAENKSVKGYTRLKGIVDDISKRSEEDVNFFESSHYKYISARLAFEIELGKHRLEKTPEIQQWEDLADEVHKYVKNGTLVDEESLLTLSSILSQAIHLLPILTSVQEELQQTADRLQPALDTTRNRIKSRQLSERITRTGDFHDARNIRIKQILEKVKPGGIRHQSQNYLLQKLKFEEQLALQTDPEVYQEFLTIAEEIYKKESLSSVYSSTLTKCLVSGCEQLETGVTANNKGKFKNTWLTLIADIPEEEVAHEHADSKSLLAQVNKMGEDRKQQKKKLHGLISQMRGRSEEKKVNRIDQRMLGVVKTVERNSEGPHFSDYEYHFNWLQAEVNLAKFGNQHPNNPMAMAFYEKGMQFLDDIRYREETTIGNFEQKEFRQLIHNELNKILAHFSTVFDQQEDLNTFISDLLTVPNINIDSPLWRQLGCFGLAVCYQERLRVFKENLQEISNIENKTKEIRKLCQKSGTFLRRVEKIAGSDPSELDEQSLQDLADVLNHGAILLKNPDRFDEEKMTHLKKLDLLSTKIQGKGSSGWKKLGICILAFTAAVVIAALVAGAILTAIPTGGLSPVLLGIFLGEGAGIGIAAGLGALEEGLDTGAAKAAGDFGKQAHSFYKAKKDDNEEQDSVESATPTP